MERHDEVGTRHRVHLGTLAAAIVTAIGLAACDTGPETLESDPRDPTQEPSQDLGQAAQPDSQLDEQAADIDIDARSTETGTAERNEAAARQNAGPGAAGEDPAALSTDETLTSETPSAADDSAAGQIAAAGSTGAVSASAVLEPTEGNRASGNASFIATEEGLEIVVTMTGLEPGQHGIHVHENGDCSGPAAEGAGDHWNPDGAEHGAPSDDPATRHAGDLGNITADASGEAELNLTAEALMVEGERGVAGKAIIVHASEDDFSTQPSGESGDPVSCGVIEVSARG